MSESSENNDAEVAAAEASDVDEIIDLPPVDLSRGFVLGGVRRSSDLEAAARLPVRTSPPPVKSKISAFASFLMIAVVFGLFSVLYWRRDGGADAVPEAKTDSRPVLFFAAGFGGALCGLWALSRYFGTTTSVEPDRVVEYVIQDECFYILNDSQLHQIGWRDPQLWQADSLWGLQEGKVVFPIARRWCGDAGGWGELSAWFAERMQVTAVPTPEGYDGDGAYEAVDHRTDWARDAASPVLARADSRVTADDIFGWKSYPNAFAPGLIFLGPSIALTAIALVLPPGGVRWLVFGVLTIAIFVTGLYFLYARRSRRELIRSLDVEPTQPVVRAACFELFGPSGRIAYRWDGLCRGESDERQIVLHVARTGNFLLLPRRLFSDQDWRRLLERVAQLPEYKKESK